MSHVVILPYYTQAEVDRYLLIADRLSQFGRQKTSFQFLLAASPATKPNRELYHAFSRIAKTTQFHCPTQVFGYPQGPTAMFWDCMDYIAQQMPGRGFSLWLESDMAPIKPNWIDRLSVEWFMADRPLLMGCLVPEVYKCRLLRQPKRLLEAHINGGACYAKDFSRRIPAEARDGVFDMAIYNHAIRLGGVRATRQIAFSTVQRVRRDMLHPNKVILHGFMQDKDEFIQRCVQPIRPYEMQIYRFHPMLDQWDMMRRRVRVWFVRRGNRAMFENMLLAKDKLESKKRAA